jgi:hypothetical protein
VYSPKLPDTLIPVLYRLARRRGTRMTALVAEAVADYPSRQADAQELLARPAAPAAPAAPAPSGAALPREAGRAR